MRCEELSPGERSTGQVEGTGGNWGLGRAYKDSFKPVRERLPSQLNKWTDDTGSHTSKEDVQMPPAPPDERTLTFISHQGKLRSKP